MALEPASSVHRTSVAGFYVNTSGTTVGFVKIGGTFTGALALAGTTLAFAGAASAAQAAGRSFSFTYRLPRA